MVDTSSTPAAAAWKKIGSSPHHGLCLPLFSLRSSTSSGIGEYTDLLPIIPWARSLGLDILQLLPLNDNGMDASPYSALSAFALNPLHLGLSHLPGATFSKQLNEELAHLRNADRINYRKIHELKEQFLRDYYKMHGREVAAAPDFRAFKSRNLWLNGFSLFKALKVLHGWKSWNAWPEEHKNPAKQDYETLLRNFGSEVNYHIFVQYLCFRQMQDIHAEAAKHGVLIKGDIPILIGQDSADVWHYPHLFHHDYSAGAPPDMYNPDGQDWGFPLYDWPAIEADDYAWWKMRLDVAKNFYDIYRLDHIVGFYRIWAKQRNTDKAVGGFIPKDEATWIPHGEKILRALLAHSTLLPIGEDLGVVPPPVRVNLRSIGICGTKVMRWERYWDEDKRFIPFDAYEPLSMTTVSTHDSETLKMWWKNHPDEAQDFSEFKRWTYSPELSVEKHFEILRDSHHTSSLFHINLLQEYLALVPGLTRSHPEDERINVPGTHNDRNWSYRFIPSVEDIIANEQLKQLFRHLCL